MSVKSHAINRLRKLWSTIYRRNARLNAKQYDYSTDLRRAATAPLLEQLEPRVLLSGTSYVVDSLADVVAADGVVTLREAIEAANTNATVHDATAGSSEEMDTITFSQGALETAAIAADPTWVPADGLTITLSGTELKITDGLTIAGLGWDVLTIDANSQSRVFNVYGSETAVEISGLTITGGHISAHGGGVNINSSDVAITNSTIVGNFALYGGGEVSSYLADVTIMNSTIAGNSVFDASAKGGGVAIQSSNVTITNSTIVGNSAPEGGGVNSYSADVTITNSTIASNTSSFGGGIRTASTTGTLSAYNSVIALNQASMRWNDIQGAYAENCFIGSIDGDPGFVRAPDVGTDNTWGTADDDYGDLRVLPGSPLVDAGDNSLIPADTQDLDDDGDTTEAFPFDLDGNARIYNTTVDIGAYEFEPLPPATLEGRPVFYNNGALDGNDPAANAADDGAIDGAKTALLPGQTATAANCTDYAKGLNGIMIDIANLAGTPTAADFGLKIGNDSDPANWAAAPTPTSISVRTGAGVNGSDRVTLTFADGAIVRQWLQVTVKATATTGLEADDVFYFGNDAPLGGDATGDSFVGLDDFTLLKANFGLSGQTFNTGDFTGDGSVGLDDFTLLKANFGQSVTPLAMISAPAAAVESMQAAVIESQQFSVLAPTDSPFESLTSPSQNAMMVTELGLLPTATTPSTSIEQSDVIDADSSLWNYQTLDGSNSDTADAGQSPFENILELPLVQQDTL